MPFTVEVSFEGLCLYVLHTDGDRAMVFMPDARLRPGEVPRYHLGNKEKAEPHVGYVRFNLANLAELPALDPPLPEGVNATLRAGPEYEVVHRFDSQILHFGAPVKPEKMTVDLAVPDFQTLAQDLELRPDLFQAHQPDRVVLLRTSLEGGELRSVRANGQAGSRQKWEFPEPFGSPDNYEGEFDSSVVWRRHVDADALPVRITDLSGNVQASFSLRPLVPGGTVAVKVANLCAVNPLEWEEMQQRSTDGPDNDFKWLYQLFRPKNGIEWDDYLVDKVLPAPSRVDFTVSEANDCMPAHTRASYPG
jgi:hypothetical protein